jgi:hypothetical protein
VGREAGCGGRGNCLEAKAKACECNDRQRQPVAKGERHGMQPEMMAEFVGEHTREFAFGKFTCGVRRDDDEVAARRKRIDVVGIEHAQHKAVSVDTSCASDLVPRRHEAVQFSDTRPACAERRGEDGNLEWPDEQRTSEDQPADGVPPPSTVDAGSGDEGAEWITRSHERQETERCEDDDRREG